MNPIDFTRYPSRHIALKIAYFGWNYHGLASQDHDTDQRSFPTIESHLMAALIKTKMIPHSDNVLTLQKAIRFSKCGRTDKGVSSYCQIVGLTIRSQSVTFNSTNYSGWELKYLDLPSENVNDNDNVLHDHENDENVDPNLINSDVNVNSKESTDQTTNDNSKNNHKNSVEFDYVSILNRNLPSDIRVLAWSPVSNEFDARFSCSSRRYKYFFPAQTLNIHAMNIAAQKYIGSHDFSRFCKIDKSKLDMEYTRTLYDAYIQPLGLEDEPPLKPYDHLPIKPQNPLEFYVFVIHGKAFLWHQVRCLMSVLYLVGMGLESPDVVDQLMDTKTDKLGKPTYDMAPEIPLVLVDCVFPKNTFQWNKSQKTILKKSLNASTRRYKEMINLYEQWRQHATKANQILSLLKELSMEEDQLLSDESLEQPQESQDKFNQFMCQVLTSVDPLTGWKGKNGKGTNSFNGCSKNKYLPLIDRPRCHGILERRSNQMTNYRQE